LPFADKISPSTRPAIRIVGLSSSVMPFNPGILTDHIQVKAILEHCSVHFSWLYFLIFKHDRNIQFNSKKGAGLEGPHFSRSPCADESRYSSLRGRQRFPKDPLLKCNRPLFLKSLDSVLIDGDNDSFRMLNSTITYP
jgi:hypothetical protein